MKYTIENIDSKNGFIFFWSNQPSKDGKITKSCLSQWWMSSFEVDGVLYRTAEHWMMAQKALVFNDKKMFDEIMQTENPADAKKLGRNVANFDHSVWQYKSFEIVMNGNMHKFSQNQILKEYLLGTEEKILVEASLVDIVWGIGLEAKNEDATNPKNWKGQNLLGFALMEVRDLLKTNN